MAINIDLKAMLSGGDRRSIGKVDEVVQLVLEQPVLFKDLFELLYQNNALIRMRSADAVEKVSALHPEYLVPFKQTLIQNIILIEQQEVRWHILQILPRLKLTIKQVDAIVPILMQEYLQDKSKIVKTFTLQALTEFAIINAKLKLKVTPILKQAIETGSPAMKSRAKKCLKMLGEQICHIR